MQGLGGRCRRARILMGLRAEPFSKLLTITYRNYLLIEKGITKNPHLDTVAEIALKSNQSIDALCGRAPMLGD